MKHAPFFVSLVLLVSRIVHCLRIVWMCVAGFAYWTKSFRFDVSDVNEIYSRIFHHRQFLTTEINYFLNEFEVSACVSKSCGFVCACVSRYLGVKDCHPSAAAIATALATTTTTATPTATLIMWQLQSIKILICFLCLSLDFSTNLPIAKAQRSWSGTLICIGTEHDWRKGFDHRKVLCAEWNQFTVAEN